MSEMDEFLTRDVANEGIKVPLFSAVTGEKTDHWLMLLGVDSDAFQKADTERRFDHLKHSQNDDKDAVFEALDLSKRRLLASLVSGWSFEQECSQENVVTFLKEARQVGDMIDKLSSNRRLFFAKRSSDSLNSPASNSDSTEQ